MEKKQYIAECERCGNTGMCTVEATYTEPEIEPDGFVAYYTEYYILRCPVCGGPIFASKDFYSQEDIDEPITVIDTKGKFIMSNATPKNIKDKMEAALKTIRIDHEVCLAAVRMVLELICFDKGETSKSKTLVKKIETLSQNGTFPPQIKDCGNLIRILGNMGVHTHGDNGISKNDVNQILKFAEFMIKYLYEMPSQIAALNKRFVSRNK